MQNKSILLILLAVNLFAFSALAQENTDKNYNERGDICGVNNRACVLKYLRAMTKDIEENTWRDQTLRELAKTYAGDGQTDTAISIISDIQNSDTKAMTIRGIAMALADLGWPKEKNDAVFKKLRAEAEKIEHPPSYAIALTYIAMGQAFAKDNEGAWATAADMKNDALRHKAYGETAEIQAEHGDFDAAMKSISFIESAAYRNKAYETISKILADRGHLDDAYNAAMVIDNPYKKAQGLQYILDMQKKLELEALQKQNDAKEEQKKRANKEP